MWMSVLIILLCIQRTLTIEPVKESVRIKNESDETKNEKKSKDKSIEQYDTQETEYEDEDLGDTPDIDSCKSSIKEGTEGEHFGIKNHVLVHKTRNPSLPSIPKLQEMIRLVRAALPSDNSSKIDEVESDMEEDEEFEDAENSGSTEEQYEAESYDSFQSTDRDKIIAISDRSKRLPINKKKGTVSPSPDLIDIGEDDSLNENDGEDYGDFLPTRKECMTVRTRERRITSKSSAHHETSLVTARHSKSGIVKDNNRVSSNSIETKPVTKKSFLHGKKGKLPKPKENIKSALRNGGESDFEELKKAYNVLVCSVEAFMALANKTMKNKLDEYCLSIGNPLSTICVPTYCKNNSQTTIDWCASSTSKLECLTTCDDSDFDSAEHSKSEEDEDTSLHMKKKYKGLKMEYPDDPAEKQSGNYVYNDYDSVDPNDYDTNVTFKSTSSPSVLISHPKHSSTFLITESGKNENNKENSKNIFSSTVSESMTTKDIPTTSRISYSTVETSKEHTITWSTFRYEAKIKLRPSRRQARRMSTEFQKILSRRKYLTRHRKQQDVPKESKAQFVVTKYPMLRNLPPSHVGDTEIIEVEYV